MSEDRDKYLDNDRLCAHGCGEYVGTWGDYCTECDYDLCLVGPEGVCGKGDNGAE